jgi:hypothetical protein
MRDNWLSNRIFKSYVDLVDHCCAAWNKLVDQPSSCPSDCANGPTGSDQWDLVLLVQKSTTSLAFRQQRILFLQIQNGP